MKDLDLISKKALRERGWSIRLINDILGEPDKKRVNMNRKSGPMVCLYSLQRVLAGERTESWGNYQETRDRRSKISAETAKKKRDDLMKWVDGLVINVEELADEEIINRAIESYNERQVNGNFSDRNSDRNFLERISVNYLRHAGTSYENLLHETFGEIGTSEAKLEIKIKTLDAIGEKYGWLSNECSKQREKVTDNANEWPFPGCPYQRVQADQRLNYFWQLPAIRLQFHCSGHGR